MWFELLDTSTGVPLVAGFVEAPSWTAARVLARRLFAGVLPSGRVLEGTAGPMLDLPPGHPMPEAPSRDGLAPCSWWRHKGVDEGGRPRFLRLGTRGQSLPNKAPSADYPEGRPAPGRDRACRGSAWR